jgi:glycosyltransferase involved in cell wall biosynthesis
MQGRFSTHATEQFVEQIKAIAPDIIHLHNLHGNYINYKVLFDYLSKADIPVVWTLHDCWPMTGHCSHFEFAKCDKWKTGCYDCPEKSSYPKSLFIDRSRKNYIEKREIFNSVKNMTIVPVSNWLGEVAKESYLKKYNVEVIHNGIDIQTFKPLESNLKEQYGIADKKVILGVATSWSKNKGFNDFLRLYDHLPQEEYQIVMIGLSQDFMAQLPSGIIGLHRTESVQELAEWYSVADVFANLSYAETFGLTTAEALASGTPAIVYNNTACPEFISPSIGRVVENGDIEAIVQAIHELCAENRDNLRNLCREYAVAHLDKNNCFDRYIDLYKKIINAR